MNYEMVIANLFDWIKSHIPVPASLVIYLVPNTKGRRNFSGWYHIIIAFNVTYKTST